MGKRLRLRLSSLLCRAWCGGTCSRGLGLHHSVTFVTEEPSGPAVNSGTLAMVFLLGRSQGRRQLLGCVKSCGLTLWELSWVGLYCAKTQLCPVPKHGGGGGSGTEAIPPSFLPFQAVSCLRQVTGLGPPSRGVGKGSLQQPWYGEGHRASSAHAGRGEGRRGALTRTPQLIALAVHQSWREAGGSQRIFGGYLGCVLHQSSCC